MKKTKSGKRRENPNCDLFTVIKTERDLTTFFSLANSTGFDDEVLRGDPLSTVFAPTNSAFNRMNQTLLNHLYQPDFILHRRGLLDAHASRRLLYAEDLTLQLLIPTFDESSFITVTMVQGEILLSGESFCNVPIVETDLLADNGVLHKVNDVLLPSNLLTNAVDLGAASVDLTTLFELIVRADLDGFVATNILTIIAPNNAAFDALLRRRLQTTDNAELSSIRRYHMIPGLFPTELLSNFQRLPTVEGSQMVQTTQTDNDGRTRYFFDSVVAIDVDLIASNAVVHEIGMVLIPPSKVPGTPTRSPTRSPTLDPTPKAPSKAPTNTPTLAPNTNGAELVLQSRNDLLLRIDEYLTYIGEDWTIGPFPDSWIPLSRWDISTITDCSALFSVQRNKQAEYFNDPDIAMWNTSSCETMKKIFFGAERFNQDLSAWDTSRVTNMHMMFGFDPWYDGQTSYWNRYTFNQKLSPWNTSQVTDMSFMFAYVAPFNQDLTGWDTSNVMNMSGMFSSASSFDKTCLRVDTSHVVDMSSMFQAATSFNQDLSHWDTSSVTTMKTMFETANSFNQDLSRWDTARVTDMTGMFRNTQIFNGNLSTWITSSVTSMSSMFNSASSYNHDMAGWNTTSVVDMSWMFAGASSFNQDVSLWNISQVTYMMMMFEGATSFNQNLCSWNERLNPSVDRASMLEGTPCPFQTPNEIAFCQLCIS